jgi:hypothetical protein
MIIEIQAFDSEGREILGSLDGQALYECKDYKRTLRYKSLRTSSYPKVHHWKVFSKDSKFSKDLTYLETVENENKSF